MELLYCSKMIWSTFPGCTCCNKTSTHAHWATISLIRKNGGREEAPFPPENLFSHTIYLYPNSAITVLVKTSPVFFPFLSHKERDMLDMPHHSQIVSTYTNSYFHFSIFTAIEEKNLNWKFYTCFSHHLEFLYRVMRFLATGAKSTLIWDRSDMGHGS